MRFFKVTACSSVAIFMILLALDFWGEHFSISDIKKIDGGTWVFLLLIIVVSQLYTALAYRFKQELKSKILTGITANIAAVLSIWLSIGVYYWSLG